MQLNRDFVSFYYDQTEDFPDYEINPSKTMLLLVDIQNEFALEDSGDALEFKENGEWDRWKDHYQRIQDQVIPNSRKLLDFFRENNLPVAFGRIACQLENGEDRSPVQKSEGWNGILLHKDSFGAQIVEELAPQEGEMVFDKTTDSVTTGTNILQVMRYMGIETVVVGGLVTDQCVASTVRGLADDGLQVITCEDACSAGDINLHRAELTIMNVIYTYVMSSDDAIELISQEL